MAVKEISVKTGKDAFKEISRFLFGAEIIFDSVRTYFNGADVFTFKTSDQEGTFVQVFCSKGNSRVEAVEVIDTNKNDSKRYPLLVLIEKPVEIEQSQSADTSKAITIYNAATDSEISFDDYDAAKDALKKILADYYKTHRKKSKKKITRSGVPSPSRPVPFNAELKPAAPVSKDIHHILLDAYYDSEGDKQNHFNLRVARDMDIVEIAEQSTPRCSGFRRQYKKFSDRFDKLKASKALNYYDVNRNYAHWDSNYATIDLNIRTMMQEYATGENKSIITIDQRLVNHFDAFINSPFLHEVEYTIVDKNGKPVEHHKPATVETPADAKPRNLEIKMYGSTKLIFGILENGLRIPGVCNLSIEQVNKFITDLYRQCAHSGNVTIKIDRRAAAEIDPLNFSNVRKALNVTFTQDNRLNIENSEEYKDYVKAIEADEIERKQASISNKQNFVPFAFDRIESRKAVARFYKRPLPENVIDFPADAESFMFNPEFSKVKATRILNPKFAKAVSADLSPVCMPDRFSTKQDKNGNLTFYVDGERVAKHKYDDAFTRELTNTRIDNQERLAKIFDLYEYTTGAIEADNYDIRQIKASEVQVRVLSKSGFKYGTAYARSYVSLDDAINAALFIDDNFPEWDINASVEIHITSRREDIGPIKCLAIGNGKREYFAPYYEFKGKSILKIWYTITDVNYVMPKDINPVEVDAAEYAVNPDALQAAVDAEIALAKQNVTIEPLDGNGNSATDDESLTSSADIELADVDATIEQTKPAVKTPAKFEVGKTYSLGISKNPKTGEPHLDTLTILKRTAKTFLVELCFWLFCNTFACEHDPYRLQKTQRRVRCNVSFYEKEGIPERIKIDDYPIISADDDNYDAAYAEYIKQHNSWFEGVMEREKRLNAEAAAADQELEKKYAVTADKATAADYERLAQMEATENRLRRLGNEYLDTRDKINETEWQGLIGENGKFDPDAVFKLDADPQYLQLLQLNEHLNYLRAEMEKISKGAFALCEHYRTLEEKADSEYYSSPAWFEQELADAKQLAIDIAAEKKAHDAHNNLFDVCTEKEVSNVATVDAESTAAAKEETKMTTENNSTLDTANAQGTQVADNVARFEPVTSWGCAIPTMVIKAKFSKTGKARGYYVDGIRARKNELHSILTKNRYCEGRGKTVQIDYRTYEALEFFPKFQNQLEDLVVTGYHGETLMTLPTARKFGKKTTEYVGLRHDLYKVKDNNLALADDDPTSCAEDIELAKQNVTIDLAKPTVPAFPQRVKIKFGKNGQKLFFIGGKRVVPKAGYESYVRNRLEYILARAETKLGVEHSEGITGFELHTTGTIDIPGNRNSHPYYGFETYYGFSLRQYKTLGDAVRVLAHCHANYQHKRINESIIVVRNRKAKTCMVTNICDGRIYYDKTILESNGVNVAEFAAVTGALPIPEPIDLNPYAPQCTWNNPHDFTVTGNINDSALAARYCSPIKQTATTADIEPVEVDAPKVKTAARRPKSRVKVKRNVNGARIFNVDGKRVNRDRAGQVQCEEYESLFHSIFNVGNTQAEYQLTADIDVFGPGSSLTVTEFVACDNRADISQLFGKFFAAFGKSAYQVKITRRNDNAFVAGQFRKGDITFNESLKETAAAEPVEVPAIDIVEGNDNLTLLNSPPEYSPDIELAADNVKTADNVTADIELAAEQKRLEPLRKARAIYAMFAGYTGDPDMWWQGLTLADKIRRESKSLDDDSAFDFLPALDELNGVDDAQSINTPIIETVEITDAGFDDELDDDDFEPDDSDAGDDDGFDLADVQDDKPLAVTFTESRLLELIGHCTKEIEQLREELADATERLQSQLTYVKSLEDEYGKLFSDCRWLKNELARLQSQKQNDTADAAPEVVSPIEKAYQAFKKRYSAINTAAPEGWFVKTVQFGVNEKSFDKVGVSNGGSLHASFDTADLPEKYFSEPETFWSKFNVWRVASGLPFIDWLHKGEAFMQITEQCAQFTKAAPRNWNIRHRENCFSVEYCGQTVATLNSLDLPNGLPPEKFFDQFTTLAR